MLADGQHTMPRLIRGRTQQIVHGRVDDGEMFARRMRMSCLWAFLTRLEVLNTGQRRQRWLLRSDLVLWIILAHDLQALLYRRAPAVTSRQAHRHKSHRSHRLDQCLLTRCPRF